MGRVKDYGTRKDGNHGQIQRAFERVCQVKDVSMVPGFVDLVVKHRGRNLLVEIKDPEQPPSNRKLTKGEQQFWEYWGEEPVIVETLDDVENLLRIDDGKTP